MGKIMRALNLIAMGVVASLAGLQVPAWAETDAEKAAAKAKTIAARQAIGSIIGGTLGNVLAGGKYGTFGGVLLAPSETGCGPNESCAEGYRREPKEELPPPDAPHREGVPWRYTNDGTQGVQ